MNWTSPNPQASHRARITSRAFSAVPLSATEQHSSARDWSGNPISGRWVPQQVVNLCQKLCLAEMHSPDSTLTAGFPTESWCGAKMNNVPKAPDPIAICDTMQGHSTAFCPKGKVRAGTFPCPFP